MTGWFKVDKEGLRKIVERRGKALILAELCQNVWDTDATKLVVSLEKLPGTPYARLIVTDDHPDGFSDLAHAYTLFAESEKKADPTKRGFMNLGEKLVLSLCRKAEVRSTKGSVHFLEDGTMKHGRKKTESGSVFDAEVRLNKEEFDEVVEAAGRLIPPRDCETTLVILEGGDETRMVLEWREPVAEFEVSLPTNIADEEGVMRRRTRKAKVQVFIPKPDEEPSIYEMGIPVVETGDKYHVNVMQKVPVNMDRDNVPPSYLTKLRAYILNHTVDLLSKDDTSEQWVTNAMESDDVEEEAVTETMNKRFGKKRAIFDPSDPEANMNLTAQGYTVVSGRSLPKRVWQNVRKSGAIKSSGSIAPTPKPYSDDPDAEPVEVIDREEWNQGMRDVEKVVREMAAALLNKPDMLVRYVKPRVRHWAACWYGGIDWNISCLGYKHFENWREHPLRIVNTIIHEFAHSHAGNHLDEGFHKGCTKLGAQLAMAMAKKQLPFLSKALKDAD